MDKSFSIGKYLLSKTGNDRETEVRLRMLCMAMAKDMPEEKRKRYIRPFFTDMEFMNSISVKNGRMYRFSRIWSS